MKSTLLQWELDWVMANADRYECPWHARAVCGNITKRYYIAVTTIWRFVTNQFTYMGRYWKDLSFRDQIDFTGTMFSTRTFDEEDVPYEDVLSMFIKVNKGVPQDATHLDAVSEQLDDLLKAKK